MSGEPSSKVAGDNADLFFQLTPETARAMLEKAGHRCTGYFFTLNSYENRVFEFELEGGERVICKFYRPGRWSRETILEEHVFLQELHREEIPVGVPLELAPGETVVLVDGIFCAAFQKIRGRSPEEFRDDDFVRMGRLIGRVHNIGDRHVASHRPRLEVAVADLSLDFLLEHGFVPKGLEDAYVQVAEDILDWLEPRLKKFPVLRLHGDCHRGNILLNKTGYHLVDFDDMMMGPAVQDLWLISPGRDEFAVNDRDTFLKGYEEMRRFDRAQLSIIEGLRAFRVINYSAWIARRWHDPVFPRLFETFRQARYWEEELNQLREVQARLSQL